MDKDYIIPKLKTLCGMWYHGEPFAKYSERRERYIFGSMNGTETIKNIVSKAVAIHLIIK